MKKLVLFSIVFIGVFFLSSTPSRAQSENKMQQAGPKIVEMKLGTDVQNKQIVGEDSTFALSGKVYLWMKVTGGADDSLIVTWKNGDHSYNGTVFVGGNSWRVWAYKTVGGSGDWTVSVSTQSGQVLKEASFTVK